MGDLLSSVEHCYNTETLSPKEMAYPQHRSFVDILSKKLYQHTADILQKNGSSKLKQKNSKYPKLHSLLKHTATNMHTFFQTF